LRAFRARFAQFFHACDLIALPTTAVTAFPIGRRPRRIRGRRVDWLWGPFPFTPMFNVAGVPAVTLPCGLTRGLPVGIQLVAPFGGDGLLLDVAEALERQLNFDTTRALGAWSATAESVPTEVGT
jgi:aspartyl-tRNA(Asn)/glutamyl-tRNA(Gln) amidotransferase subunit A